MDSGIWDGGVEINRRAEGFERKKKERAAGKRKGSREVRKGREGR